MHFSGSERKGRKESHPLRRQWSIGVCPKVPWTAVGLATRKPVSIWDPSTPKQHLSICYHSLELHNMSFKFLFYKDFHHKLGRQTTLLLSVSRYHSSCYVFLYACPRVACLAFIVPFVRPGWPSHESGRAPCLMRSCQEKVKVFGAWLQFYNCSR